MLMPSSGKCAVSRLSKTQPAPNAWWVIQFVSRTFTTNQPSPAGSSPPSTSFSAASSITCFSSRVDGQFSLASRDGRSRPLAGRVDWFVPLHARHAPTRGGRAHALQAGEDPRLVLHRARERGGFGRRRRGDGARRRRLAAAPQRRRPRPPRHRAVADLRQLPRPRRRALPRARREHPSRRPRPRADHDRQPSAGDAPGRRRLRARLPHPRASHASRSAGSARERRPGATPTRR